MKKFVVLLAALLSVACVGLFCSCAKKDDTPQGQGQPENSEVTENDLSKKDIEGINFSDKTFTYDGTERMIAVEGDLPEGVSVAYQNNKATNAGTYAAKATLSGDGYNTKVLNATLTINKADLSGVEFISDSFEYDGNFHSIYVSGNIPSDATVTYSSETEGIKNSAKEVGVYKVFAKIESNNFKVLELSAELKITATDDERYIKVSGNTVFFQNAMDENKLYAFSLNDDKLLKVSNDYAVYMEIYDDDSIVYVSKSLIASSIRKASYDSAKGSASCEIIYNKNAEYIQKENENVFYFAVNGLTNKDSGIYKLTLSGENASLTCLSQGKAKYLKLYGDKLYFADSTNGDKLSCIKTSGSSGRTLVVDEKINNLILHDGCLFYTVNNLLGDYIEKYDINSGTRRKLTQDAGIGLTVIGTDLYYISVDLNTAIIGKGIFKVDINPLTDNNLPGTKVIDGGEMGVCSLTSNGSNLIYYDVNGYKLMNYSVSKNTATNILEGFTKPEDPTPTSFGSQVNAKDGVIYYLDIYDGKTLHSYDPVSKNNFRLTTEKVDNFSIIGDYIYMNMVTYGLNNDTYRMNIKTMTAPEMVNSYDVKQIISDGKYMYYVYCDALGAAKSIHKADMDGQNDIEIFEYAADNLVLYNGTLYFCAKPTAVQTIMKIENVATVTTAQEKVCVNSDYACDVFTISDGVIYFRENYGLAWKYHRLSKMNVDGTGYAVMVTSATDPVEIVVADGYVYYANSADTAGDYNLYRISVNGKEGEQQKLTNGMYVSEICVVGNKVYYINYYLGGTLGDSHLYEIGTDGSDVKKVA